MTVQTLTYRMQRQCAISARLCEDLYGTEVETLCKRLKKQKTCHVVEVDQKLLPDLFEKHLKYHPNGYVFFCKSHMGSGKTFQLQKLIMRMTKYSRNENRQFRVLAITPRRTFASFLEGQLKGFYHYRSVKKPYNYIRYPKLVVQLQSLCHFQDIDTDSNSISGYSLLIMDEIHSIVQELFSDLFSTEEQLRFMKIFVKVLKAIPRWFCSDAHLSTDLINALIQIASDYKPDLSRICLINKYSNVDYKLIFHRKCLFSNTVLNLLRRKLIKLEHFESYKPFLCAQQIRKVVSIDGIGKIDKIFKRIYIRDFLASSDSDDILTYLHRDLTSGKKICVTSSTKKQAVLIKDLFKTCGFKVKLLTGSSTCEKKKCFTDDPETYIKRCDLFIYTTAFQVGIDVSSRVPYFDKQYIFISCSENVPAPSSLMQTIGRIRTLISKQYIAVVIINSRFEKNQVFSLDDNVSLKHDHIFPKAKLNPVLQNFIDLHLKEKLVNQNVHVFIDVFIRLMSYKAKPFVKLESGIQDVSEVVNFQSFHYCLKDYERFVDKFICKYTDELTAYFEKYVHRVWDKLETESVFVSTIVNNYDAFIRLPPDMPRAECLMRVCEFTNSSLGFIYSFIFSKIDNDILLIRYFEQQLNHFCRKCSVDDLLKLKHLFDAFVKCCNLQKGCRKCSFDGKKFSSMLEENSSNIVVLFSKFVRSAITNASTPQTLFLTLLSKVFRVYISNFMADFTELYQYLKIIDIPKWVKYNAESTVSL